MYAGRRAWCSGDDDGQCVLLGFWRAAMMILRLVGGDFMHLCMRFEGPGAGRSVDTLLRCYFRWTGRPQILI